MRAPFVEILMLAALAVAEIAWAQAPAALEPVPDAPSLQRAERLFRDIYKPYPPANPLDRANLAQKLISAARQVRNDPPSRYILLREARRLAEDTGRIPIALEAINAMGEAFAIDVPAAKLDAMIACRQSPFPPDMALLAKVGMELCESAAEIERYDLAVRAAVQAQFAAERGSDRALHQSIMTRVREMRQIEQDFRQAKLAIERLRLRPDEPESNLIVGRFACFVKEAWDRGLPLLAKGSDMTLRSLAEMELARPADLAGQLTVAEKWWEYGEKQTGVTASAAQRHAARCYQAILPRLTGLQKSQAEQRIAQVLPPPPPADTQPATGKLEPGLVGRYYSGKAFDQLIKTRIDSQIAFEWEMAAPDPGLPADAFSARWTGYIVAPKPGKYTIGILVDDGARLWIDGSLAIDHWLPFTASETYTARVDLTGEPQKIRLDFFEGVMRARIRLMWAGPDDAALVPVPAEALFHQP